MNDGIEIELIRRINKQEILRAISVSVKEAMPKLSEERLYEVITEGIKQGVAEYLRGRK